MIAAVKSLICAALILATGVAYPQASVEYPIRPIRFVVPFPPGGATDVVARLVGDKLSRAWGQQVIVENRAGAGGLIGAGHVLRATPDGYTLLVGNTGIVQNALLASKPPYDPMVDFAPVTQLNLAPSLLCVHPALPAATLSEFIVTVKREPKKHSFGSAGIGQTLHLFGELLNKSAALDMAHVPFQGEAPMINNLLAGHVSSAFATIASSRAHIQAGKLRAIAVIGPTRSPLLPDVPTFRELGYINFDAMGWYGMLAPAGTPKAIVDKVAREVNLILKMTDVAARLNELALTPTGTGPEEFAKIIRGTHADWTRILKETKVGTN